MKRLLSLVILVGCGGNVDQIESSDFSATVSIVWCDRVKECNRSYYDAMYDSRSDCLDRESVTWQETHDYFLDAGCQYTPESGATLYNLLQEMSCGDFYNETFLDDFDNVWKC
jgi:hypothetical protein